LLHEPALELPIAAGPLPLCHADDHRRLPGLEARVGLIGFANGRAQHARELRGAAPRLLERNLAADDPLAGRIDEASFLEIVDAAAGVKPTAVTLPEPTIARGALLMPLRPRPCSGRGLPPRPCSSNKSCRALGHATMHETSSLQRPARSQTCCASTGGALATRS